MINPTKKKKTVDLVKLNTNVENVKKNDKKIYKQQERLLKKNNKEKLKLEKKKLLEERKIKKAKEKMKIKEAGKIKKNLQLEKVKQKKIDKGINNNSKLVKKVIKKNIEIKTDKNLPSNNNIQINSAKTQDLNSICDEIKDCDIDKITEILSKKGKEKPFPNISSN